MESEKENKMLAEEIKELKERVSGGGGMMPMGQRIMAAVESGNKKVSRKFHVVDSFTTVEFIIQEQKNRTLYIGDWEHKSLIVVPEGASEPCCSVELASHPFCAVLVCKNSMLVVG